MSSASQDQTYKAFISYSQKDNRACEKLHRWLERYPIPREHRDHLLPDGSRLGKYVRPIFKDREELSSSSDHESPFRVALQNSLNLIVLCSPDSATSQPVANEVDTFRELHSGKENIHALILWGEPNSGDEATECFPLGLRGMNQPLAADYREGKDGDERARFKILAGITGLPFDKLYNRHLRITRRRWQLGMSLASLFVGLLASISAYAFWQRDQAIDAREIAQGQTQLAQEREREARIGEGRYWLEVAEQH
ncbi:MAG: TIR domain-containing protein, partial [Verrucomicrobiota bacterium]